MSVARRYFDDAAFHLRNAERSLRDAREHADGEREHLVAERLWHAVLTLRAHAARAGTRAARRRAA